MWGTDGWEKRKSKFVQVQPGGRSPSIGDTRVQFHNDQVRLLVVHESQLAVYDASKLERLRQVTLDLYCIIQVRLVYLCNHYMVLLGSKQMDINGNYGLNFAFFLHINFVKRCYIL